MEYAKRMVSGASKIFISTIIVLFLGYILRVTVARRLGVEDYGLFYAIMSFLGIFAVINNIGLSTAVSKFFAEYLSIDKLDAIKSALLKILCVQVLIGIFIFLILFFGSDIISSSFFHNPAAALTLIIFAIEFLFGSTTLRHVLLGMRRISAYSSTEPVRILLILALLMVIPGTVSWISAAFVLASITITIFTGSYVWYILRPWKLQNDHGLTKKMVKFGFTTFSTSIIAVIITNTDILALTYFRSFTEVGFYQAALPTSQILLVFAVSIGTILLPIVSEMWARKQKSEIAKGISLLLRLSFVFLMPLAVISIAFPDMILNLLFGSSFIPASSALQILVIAAVAYTPYALLSTSLVAIGHPAKTTKIALIVACFNLITNIILVPILGIVGAATTTVVSYILGSILSVHHFNKFARLQLDIIGLIKILAISIFVLFFVFGIKAFLVMEAWPEAILISVLSIAFYVLLAFLSRIITLDDINYLKTIGIPIPFSFFRRFSRKN